MRTSVLLGLRWFDKWSSPVAASLITERSAPGALHLGPLSCDDGKMTRLVELLKAGKEAGII